MEFYNIAINIIGESNYISQNNIKKFLLARLVSLPPFSLSRTLDIFIFHVEKFLN